MMKCCVSVHMCYCYQRSDIIHCGHNATRIHLRPAGRQQCTYTNTTLSHLCGSSRDSLSFYRHFLQTRAPNIVRRPCSDSSHVTAPYELFYYFIIIYFYIRFIVIILLLFLSRQKAAGWRLRKVYILIAISTVPSCSSRYICSFLRFSAVVGPQAWTT